MRLLFIFAFSFTACAACLPITGDRIFGRDLALIDPRFDALPAALILASAPVPGTQRVFAVAELARLARAHGITIDQPAQVCFEIPVRQITGDEALREMRRALPGADLSIVELSQTPVPSGTVEFPVSGLEPASVSDPDVQIWRGYVRYSDTRRMPVWARVSISETLTAVVASKDLAANVAIDAGGLRLEKRSGAPIQQNIAIRLEDVVGRIPKRAVKAGALIPLAILEKAPDIRRGEAVRVEVVSGFARLQLNAVAERDGRSGELVELRNPSSGKTFRARLEGSKAVIVVGTSSGL